MLTIIVAAALGAILGLAGSRLLWLGSWTLLPWALAGLALGYWARKCKPALLGGVYGFVLSFVFMAAGYTGSAPFLTRVPFFTILALFGAVCGLILSLSGAALGRRIARPKSSSQHNR